jgi:stage II sporulation protein P
MKKSYINSLLLLVIILSLLAAVRWQQPAVSPQRFTDESDEISREDIVAERYWRMVDEKSKEIMVTGRRIHVGDEYITSDNKLYRVYRVRGRTAYARLIREVGALYEEERSFLVFRLIWSVPTQAEEDGDDLAPEEEPQWLIGVYHTHNAESYVPTDGADSIYGQGGIHSVGAAFTGALEEKGVRVIHDQTLHLPHDRGAYRRSRPTALRLLSGGPDAIFDVHRDAAPRHVYAAEIEGRWVTQVKLVVGRQNPNMRVNRQFALDLKNTADEVQPGLVKGIFMARGNYNQDLSPLKLLLEVGAHTNSREAAEEGIAQFSEVVATYFYGPPEEREPKEPAPLLRPLPEGARTAGANRSAVISILLLLAFTAAVALGFVLLNTGRFRDLADLIAPYMDRVQHWLAPADRYLDPLRHKIYDNTGSLRRNLEPAADKVDLFFAAAGRSLVHSLSRADHHLAILAEKIYVTGERVWAALVPILESGEEFALPIRRRIRDIALNIQAAVNRALEAGDRFLAPRQDRIHKVALTARERLREILDRRRVR